MDQPLKNLTDCELFELAKDNRRAGAVLLERYHPMVDRYIRSKVNDCIVADDLVHDTLEAILLAPHKQREDKVENVAGFIIGIAKFKVMGHYRQLKRAPQDDESIDRLTVEKLAGEGPFDFVANNRDGQILAQALRRIPVEDQTILLLCLCDELSRGQVGQMLGLNTATVRTKLRKAREAARSQIRFIRRGFVKLRETSQALLKWQREVRGGLDDGE